MDTRLFRYVGFFRTIRDHIRETATQLWASIGRNNNNGSNGSGAGNHEQSNFRATVQQKLDRIKGETAQKIASLSGSGPEDFSHVYRRKTRMEMVKISAAVCGIEFAYAGETAFVTPLLLNLGLRHRHLTLMWFLSPLLGFFLTPILGSMSDGCRSKFGRRRPFIILLSIGIILGLLLVPNGKLLGIWFGDSYKTNRNIARVNDTAKVELDEQAHFNELLDELPKFKNGSENATNGPAINSHYSRFHHLLPTPVPRHSRIDHAQAHAQAELSGLHYEKLGEPNSYPGTVKTSTSTTTGTTATVVPTTTEEEVEFDWPPFRDPAASRAPPASIGLPQTVPRKRKHKTINETLLRTLLHDFTNEWERVVHAPRKRTDLDFEEQELNSTRTRNGMTNKEYNIRLKKLESDDRNYEEREENEWKHSWGLLFTILGTVLLDFDADACQSPSRAFMLDVTVPEDQARGLSTFTIISGMGGALGYFLGAIDWESTFIGNIFGGHVRAVFILILFIFIGCVITTIKSFHEIPLDLLNSSKLLPAAASSVPSATIGVKVVKRIDSTRSKKRYSRFVDEDDSDLEMDNHNHNNQSLHDDSIWSDDTQETSFSNTVLRFNEPISTTSTTSAPSVYSSTTNSLPGGGRPISSISSSAVVAETTNSKLPTFKDYVKTIIYLPNSLKWLCLTNFFSWFSLVCYSLYFTDFVGEAVYGGNPNSPEGSNLRIVYQDGVRFGCLGMALYSVSCSLYSFVIEILVEKFRAKRVYICGHLTYSIGMFLMALSCSKVGVLVFSWTSGIMYATLFTMPYLLVARYHASEIFDVNSLTTGTTGELTSPTNVSSLKRGLGTDVAIVSSMVFLAQMFQSLILGTIVELIGSTVAIIYTAGFAAIFGALAASKVLYLDL